jgi:hypothetical protein
MRASSTLAIVAVLALVDLGCHGPEPSPVAPRPPSVVTINGGVGNMWLDAVLANVTVIDGPASGLSATTDEHGSFELTGPFGGTNVTLRVSADGYATGVFTVSVDPGGRCSCAFNLIPTGFSPVVRSQTAQAAAPR